MTAAGGLTKQSRQEGATASAARRLHGLPPVAARDARVLVLGSFPSAMSLAMQQYYAHPQNRFWLLLGQIFGDGDWRALPYERRLRLARAAGIAIWDIYGSCERSGSMDAQIRDPEYNDFASLLARAPGIKRVCFNGTTAARAVEHLASFDLETMALPSTSPANAGQGMDYKLARWSAALGASKR